MPFSRNDDGTVSQRPFGGLSYPRTAYAGAETGHHMLHSMYEQVMKRGIEVYDEWYVTQLAVTGHDAVADRECHGVVAFDVATGEVAGFRARDGVVLATGGAGQVFEHTTNAVANTGDGVAMAYRAGVPIEDMEMVQFHPTTLPSTGVLITEGVRGEGGRLFNADGERFMFERGYAVEEGELASRDVVSRAELTEIAAGRGVEDDHVHLDMRHLGEERIMDRLENIVHLARDFEGVDPLEKPMPVKPGAHYTMGGIETNEWGETVIDGLYAAGECGCVSMHGANRLGGNSLAETLVFGARAGRAAAGADVGTPEIPVGPDPSAEREDRDWPIDPGERGPGPATDVATETPLDDPESVIEATVTAERERIDTMLSTEAGVSQAAVRSQVQEAMGEHVNVFREESGIETALAEIEAAREAFQDLHVTDTSRTFNTELQHAFETRNVIDLAEAVALGALAREESRGAHWRKAHQEREDEEWRKHTMVSWNDGEPELWYRPNILESEVQDYDPTERTY
jgi:succinate dehydrogenase / fumarate reductase flavoprotein subunit